tara:strand:- start:363 stop:1535 length:1173 start_codon:yes stop_codon:yes gene_type:complete
MDSKKYKINEVNAWNGWDPLKQVVLGNVFDTEIFENIGDHKLRDLLQQILYETYEDLMGIKKTLEDLGVEVIQPPRNTINYFKDNDTVYDDKNVFDLDSNMSGMTGLPRPCLTPRDHFLTLGNKLLATTIQVGDSGQTFNPKCVDMFFKEQWNLYQDGKIPHGPIKPSTNAFDMASATGEESIFNEFTFAAPVVHRVGNRLIVDVEDYTNLDKVLLERYQEFTGANIAVGGHTDGSMNLPKPGLVICAPFMSKEDFKDSLPGWDVLRIENPNYMRSDGDIHHWAIEKDITKGRWWHPEAKSNPELVSFVEEWLSKWVGYAEESIFEVNMLSVNEEVILSMNYQKEVHTALKKHGIEPIYCRFRHRNFWDGGLHCLTLDTVREGGIQDYFK